MKKQFVIIPAIDLIEGCCVRLLQGRKDRKTIYSKNPAEMAKKFESEGAKRLHVVDLDGAFSGSPQNLKVVEKICSSISIPVELGGGIRDIKTIQEVFNAGVSYAIVGTAAIKNSDFIKEIVREYGNKIIVGIDAKDGKVAIEGWVNVGKMEAVHLAQKMSHLGVKTIIFTDIKTDGMLTGPNINSLTQMADTVPNIDVIASGGISSIDDLKAVKELNRPNIIGAITGKAIYEKKIDLKEAVRELA